MNKPLRLLFVLLVAAVAGTAVAGVARAADFRGDEENPRVTGTIDDDVYVAGNDISISADVAGEVWAAGQEVTLEGSTGGAMLAAAQTISVPGRVGGTARLMAQSITIGGEVEGDLMGAAQEIEVEADASVERDLWLAAQQVDVIGNVGRDIHGTAQRVTITGIVGGDVRVEAEEVRLEPGARVEGDLIYTSVNRADIDQQATVAGRVVRREPAEPRLDDAESVLLRLLRSIAGGLILGLVLLWLLPRFLPTTSGVLRNSPLASLGVGLAAVILAPLVAVFLFVLAGWIGAGFSVPLVLLVAYLLLLLLSRVIVAFTIGALVLRIRPDDPAPSRGRLFFSLLIGVVVLSALGLIPALAALINFIVILLAMGAAILASFRWRKGPNIRTEIAGRPDTPPTPAPASTSATAEP